ncbi:hypothetical protein [Streptomyces decoyicus]|uniref:hypothetical protein n=1 Tax=Streptomyces decoyicus TaxID=249567 RepID=UPI003653310F
MVGPGGRGHRAAAGWLAGRPTPEGARLAALILDTCPPERAAGLNQRARAALGPAPSADEIDQVLPAEVGPDRASGRIDPLASWLRVWDWSPVLPAELLADFAPLLAAVRRLKPAGPPDPRAAARPVPRHHPVALEDLLERAATAGPLAAAAALVAEDAGADGYALVLQRLVDADPAAWTAAVPAVPAVLATLVRPRRRSPPLSCAAPCPPPRPANRPPPWWSSPTGRCSAC